eukprot:GAHX01001640.1.p1 GENE.GAHX01001640.1~~GAHX01001640.1.p1  ORF type:complete len:429 (-),score=79.28 GAHX01001640.1:32-1318(-)
MGGLPTKLKKPTHFTKKEVLKHLSLKDDQFRKLIINSGIYIKWPNHRRYKGRRDKKYYSKTDIRYLRNSIYYKYLCALNSHNKTLVKAEGKGMHIKSQKISQRTPESPVLEMIESRYEDFKSLIRDVGEEASNLAIINYNEKLFDLLLKSEKKTIKFVLNNNLDNIEKTFVDFIEFIKKEGLLTNLFLSKNYAVLTCSMYQQRVSFRLPYCSLMGDLNCVKEGKLPKQEDIKVDLTLFQDYGNYSQKVIEYFLKYIDNIKNNEYKLKDENVYNEKKSVFNGIKVLFITENFNKDIIEITSYCGGVECIDTLNTSNISNITVKNYNNKTHLITDLKKKQLDVIIKNNNIKIGKRTEIVHLQWLIDSFNQSKMLPESKYGLDKQLPLHKDPLVGNKVVLKGKAGKNLELTKAMMSSVQEELYEEVKRRIG